MPEPAASGSPAEHPLPFRPADFSTLTDALDYAARGERGSNFYTGRGVLYESLTYTELRMQSRDLAKRLMGLGLERGARVALVAETDVEFIRFFYACQYACLVPVALPASFKVGAHSAYVAQLKSLLEASDAAIAVASEGYLPFLREASQGLRLIMVDQPATFYKLPDLELPFPKVEPEDISYIQYTSGSTRFPRGVVIKHSTAMANLRGIVIEGLAISEHDRFMSWLPFYHDMGLVGFVLVPMATQSSVDYLDTREFAMRPRQWLALMTLTKATISFAPSFGYDLCARRIRPNDLKSYELSHWRVAGIGAEMIRPETLDKFSEILKPCGFRSRAFTACYGMAECTLGVSFSSLERGFTTDILDSDHLSEHHEALVLSGGNKDGRGRHFVNCGRVLSSFEIEIRDKGKVLGDMQSGLIFLRGPSVMSGYFNSPDETESVLSEDGWLNTGDIGYMSSGVLTITGRKKDIIIIHGKNIWPQDLEYVAESQDDIRSGDVVAFSAPGVEGEERCVLLVQCREQNTEKRRLLIEKLTSVVRTETGIDCHVELVPSHSLPRTSSGKLSRSKARLNFLAELEHRAAEMDFYTPVAARVASA